MVSVLAISVGKQQQQQQKEEILEERAKFKFTVNLSISYSVFHINPSLNTRTFSSSLHWLAACSVCCV